MPHLACQEVQQHGIIAGDTGQNSQRVQQPDAATVLDTHAYADFRRGIFNQVDQSVAPQSEGTYHTSTNPVSIYLLPLS